MSDSAYAAPFRPYAYDRIEEYVVDRIERRGEPPDRMVAHGEQLRAAMAEKDSALTILLDRLREDMGNAALDLLDADLFTTAGIEAAQAAQAKARTFIHLLSTIKVAIEAADRVVEAGIDQMVDEQDDAIRRQWDT